MNQDINDYLDYEVKREIANRYFSFRKLIEEDIQNYDDQIIASLRQLEQSIGFELVRLYILLKDEKVIHDFFALIGLRELLFFDPYLAQSPTIRRRVFAGRPVRGLTQAARFRNMLYDTYEDLSFHVASYRKRFTDLVEERRTIADEINLFYQKNDLGVIMGFLRGLAGSGDYKAGSMEGGINVRQDEELEKKMKLVPPPSVSDLLPDIPLLAPLRPIRKKMRAIIDRAWALQAGLELRDITHP